MSLQVVLIRSPLVLVETGQNLTLQPKREESLLLEPFFLPTVDRLAVICMEVMVDLVVEERLVERVAMVRMAVVVAEAWQMDLLMAHRVMVVMVEHMAVEEEAVEAIVAP